MEIIIENLNKKYGKHEVLNNINLNIPVGLYGLLGENADAYSCDCFRTVFRNSKNKRD